MNTENLCKDYIWDYVWKARVERERKRVEMREMDRVDKVGKADDEGDRETEKDREVEEERKIDR